MQESASDLEAKLRAVVAAHDEYKRQLKRTLRTINSVRVTCRERREMLRKLINEL